MFGFSSTTLFLAIDRLTERQSIYPAERGPLVLALREEVDPLG